MSILCNWKKEYVDVFQKNKTRVILLISDYILHFILGKDGKRYQSYGGDYFMNKDKHLKLTTGEMAQLWAQYMNDSGSVCVLTHFLEKAEDEEIRPVIEFALNLSKTHIQKLTSFFVEEDYVVPNGFKVEEHVNLTSSKLFSDSFVLEFINQMTKIGLTTYAASVASSVREDITDYFMECTTETMQLCKMTKDLLLSKGLYVKTPYMQEMEHVEYVKSQGFMLDVFGEKRPLIVAEIDNLYANLQRNALGAATLVGFSQVAKDKEVKQFFQRGIKIANKHVKLFGAKLEESYLPVPMTLASEVTSSTDQTFSDQLMMFFTSGLIALSIGFYGTGVAQSPRMDLGVMYNRLSLEVQLYSEDGSNILIDNEWLEQPPMVLDRDELAQEKE